MDSNPQQGKNNAMDIGKLMVVATTTPTFGECTKALESSMTTTIDCEPVVFRCRASQGLQMIRTKQELTTVLSSNPRL